MTDREQLAAALVADAARTTVRQLAPEELEVFDGVVAGWRERPTRIGRQQPAPGSSVGFGIDTALVTDVVLQAVVAAVSEVLVLGVTGVGAELRASWRRRRGQERVAEPVGPSDGEPSEVAGSGTDGTGSPTAANQLGLTGSQVEELRRACRRHALALGLSAESADLLADATVGAMVAPGPR